MTEPIEDRRREEPETPVAPAEDSAARRIVMFLVGFGLAILLMIVGASAGAQADLPGILLLGVGAPVLLIVIARWSGNRPLTIGAISALAVVAVTFGGCLMLLSI